MTSQNFHYRLGKGPSAAPRSPLRSSLEPFFEISVISHPQRLWRIPLLYPWIIPGISWEPATHERSGRYRFRRPCTTCSPKRGVDWDGLSGEVARQADALLGDEQAALILDESAFAKKGTAFSRCGPYVERSAG